MIVYNKKCFHCKEHYPHSESVHNEELRLVAQATQKPKPSK
jgi:hypothetical protein